MDEQRQILYMQTRLIRLAGERWNKTADQVIEIFRKNSVLDHIADCFGVFHVQGDEAVLDDIEYYIENKKGGSENE